MIPENDVTDIPLSALQGVVVKVVDVTFHGRQMRLWQRRLVARLLRGRYPVAHLKWSLVIQDVEALGDRWPVTVGKGDSLTINTPDPLATIR